MPPLQLLRIAAGMEDRQHDNPGGFNWEVMQDHSSFHLPYFASSFAFKVSQRNDVIRMVKFVLETAVNQFRFAGREFVVKFITELLENFPLLFER